MKILCFIDSLGCGGAQRQLTALAVALNKRGHCVRFLVYHREDHFLPALEAAGIPCQILSPCSYWQRVLRVRRALNQGWQDVVLAFLEKPAVLAEFARLPNSRWGLVVGERSADPRMRRGVHRWLRRFHRFADAVIANSHTNRLMIKAGFPTLKRPCVTLYNVVDSGRFRQRSAQVADQGARQRGVIRVVVGASYQANKNLAHAAEAMRLLNDSSLKGRVVMDWYGGMPQNPSVFQDTSRFIRQHGLGDVMRLHGPVSNIEDEFRNSSAVALFSYFEGLPNAVCEAMACGIPIVLSNVCDAGNLVREGKNGFLCDPASPGSMADALKKLAQTSDNERVRMGQESRRMANQLFAEEKIVDRYERILAASARRRSVSEDCGWPKQTPASAERTVNEWLRVG